MEKLSTVTTPNRAPQQSNRSAMDRTTDGTLPESSTKRKKLVVVVKGRKTASKQQVSRARPAIVGRRIAGSAGIPSRTVKSVRTPLTGEHDKQQPADDPFGDDLEDEMPSETLMVIRALQNNHETSISIPLQNFERGSNPFVRGVMECQVHSRLTDTTSNELQELLDSRDMDKALVQLRAPSHGRVEEVPAILLLAKDYTRGVIDAKYRYLDGQTDRKFSNEQVEETIDWIVRHQRDWIGRFIKVSALKKAHEKDPVISVRSVDGVLSLLQDLQILLPCHQQSTYQLWLPEWGNVLKAWSDARTKLLAAIKRSYYGEKSKKSLTQTYSHIATDLIIEWLRHQGIVSTVERPSGIFVRLTSRQK